MLTYLYYIWYYIVSVILANTTLWYIVLILP